MKKTTNAVVLEPAKPLVRVVRGWKIILDVDLARIYGVPTKRPNEQMRCNAERFPTDFAFRLTDDEAVRVQFTPFARRRR